MWKVTLEDDRLVFTPFFGDPAADQDPDQCLAEYQKRRERYARCEMDLQNRDEDLQDLKLENDRLQQQNELMKEYIHAIACVKSGKSKYYGHCKESNCPYFDHDKEFGQGACTLSSRDLIEQEASDIIEKLEELG